VIFCNSGYQGLITNAFTRITDERAESSGSCHRLPLRSLCFRTYLCLLNPYLMIMFAGSSAFLCLFSFCGNSTSSFDDEGGHFSRVWNLSVNKPPPVRPPVWLGQTLNRRSSTLITSPHFLVLIPVVDPLLSVFLPPTAWCPKRPLVIIFYRDYLALGWHHCCILFPFILCWCGTCHVSIIPKFALAVVSIFSLGGFNSALYPPLDPLDRSVDPPRAICSCLVPLVSSVLFPPGSQLKLHDQKCFLHLPKQL